MAMGTRAKSANRHKHNQRCASKDLMGTPPVEGNKRCGESSAARSFARMSDGVTAQQTNATGQSNCQANRHGFYKRDLKGRKILHLPPTFPSGVLTPWASAVSQCGSRVGYAAPLASPQH